MLHAPDAAVVEDWLWSKRLERFAGAGGPQQLVCAPKQLEWTPAEFALRLEALLVDSASASSSLSHLLAHLDALIARSELLFVSGADERSTTTTSAGERSAQAIAPILSHLVVLLRHLHRLLVSEPPLPNQLLARVTQLWLNLNTLASRRYSLSQSVSPTDHLLMEIYNLQSRFE